jgi:hypothetical protein
MTRKHHTEEQDMRALEVVDACRESQLKGAEV